MTEPTVAPTFIVASDGASSLSNDASVGGGLVGGTAGSAGAFAASPRTAGQLLRQARQAQGMHVAALAAAIKVSPQKLEALENERFDQLPDPTFARALALAICRYLKVDPEPVMSRLPQPREHRLEHINRGLATPFRSHGGGRDDGGGLDLLRPAVLAPALVLIAALAVYVVPDSMWKIPTFGGDASAPVASSNGPSSAPDATPSAAEDPASAGSVPSEKVSPDAIALTPSSAALMGGRREADTASPPLTASPLIITATRESWIEVVDGGGRTLVSRSVPAGETLDLDGPTPLKLRIGNAVGTQVTFKGQSVSLATATKDNVARLELK